LLKTLTVRLVATTAALTCILLAVLFWQLQIHVDTIHDRTLTSQAKDISRHLKRAPDGSLKVDLPPELARAYSAAKSGYYFQVRDRTGALLMASSIGAKILDEAIPTEGEGAEFFLLPNAKGRRVYAASVPVHVAAGDFVIRVAQGESHSDILIDELLEEFVFNTGWVLPLILAFFLLVNFVTVRHSLAPIETISSAVTALGPSDRIMLPEDDLPDEILPLVRAVNSAFGRLDDALRTQREFTADAAHELRTPLAVLNANIDTLSEPASRAALKQDVRVMTRIVDQLLKVAQLDAFVLDATQRADLCAVVSQVAARLGHLAIERGKSISVTVPDSPVYARGNPIILEHGISNLVENALSHTPEGEGVEITIDESGTIHVDDAGPGVPEGERRAVFQRFWRKEHQTNGAGIGLSIVSKIAEAHRGSVCISTSPLGGARFSLTLPLYG